MKKITIMMLIGIMVISLAMTSGCKTTEPVKKKKEFNSVEDFISAKRPD